MSKKVNNSASRKKVVHMRTSQDFNDVSQAVTTPGASQIQPFAKQASH